MIGSLTSTFIAALRSVGTAATMAMAGFYLHRRGFVNAEGKKALARLSQQVTIPALFFSKIIYCPQDFSEEKCPNIADNLSDVWVLLLWPLFVVGCGLLVGDIAARISGTPPWQRRSVIAAVAFANSTGLPITLLTVVHANFPATSEIGRIDPNLFLSVYLLLYPILQWGIGGWLLAPGDEKSDIEIGASLKGGVHHILNITEEEDPQNMQLPCEKEAAARMIKELSLTDLFEAKQRQEQNPEKTGDTNGSTAAPKTETTSLVSSAKPFYERHDTGLAYPTTDMAPLTETIGKVLPKALQPPVVGALLGLFIASIPQVRGIFVDLETRADKAPLEWLFDGIYSVGLAAVPINMCILGINLSLAAAQNNNKSLENSHNRISSKTIASIVISKMVVMPLIGIVTALILKNYFWHIPDDIDGPFYLVLMIVTITPTANNVMVMVELGGGSKEGMARIIGWQYAFAPVVLSMTVMLVVRVACLW